MVKAGIKILILICVEAIKSNNIRALGMAGSVMTIGLSINGGLYSKNQFDEGKRD